MVHCKLRTTNAWLYSAAISLLIGEKYNFDDWTKDTGANTTKAMLCYHALCRSADRQTRFKSYRPSIVRIPLDAQRLI